MAQRGNKVTVFGDRAAAGTGVSRVALFSTGRRSRRDSAVHVVTGCRDRSAAQSLAAAGTDGLLHASGGTGGSSRGRLAAVTQRRNDLRAIFLAAQGADQLLQTLTGTGGSSDLHRLVLVCTGQFQASRATLRADAFRIHIVGSGFNLFVAVLAVKPVVDFIIDVGTIAVVNVTDLNGNTGNATGFTYAIRRVAVIEVVQLPCFFTADFTDNPVLEIIIFCVAPVAGMSGLTGDTGCTTESTGTAVAGDGVLQQTKVIAALNAGMEMVGIVVLPVIPIINGVADDSILVVEAAAGTGMILTVIPVGVLVSFRATVKTDVPMVVLIMVGVIPVDIVLGGFQAGSAAVPAGISAAHDIVGGLDRLFLAAQGAVVPMPFAVIAVGVAPVDDVLARGAAQAGSAAIKAGRRVGAGEVVRRVIKRFVTVGAMIPVLVFIAFPLG